MNFFVNYSIGKLTCGVATSDCSVACSINNGGEELK